MTRPPRPRATPNGTANRILDVAERLVQTQGWNGFSYADIAGDIGITKASLHYHFATKAALGSRLITRYRERFQAGLVEIDATETDARRKLRRYVELYDGVLRKNRMCLCGMLAADFTTLAKEMRAGVKAFFDANEVWLAGVLDKGRAAKEVRFPGPALEEARLLVGSLEGAMLVARSQGDVARFASAATRILTELEAPAATPRVRATH
jgi:TetR/AcrR family transcriptional regulator, transcriptional repressor for nem operon